MAPPFLRKPPALKPGDTVAAVTLSWGGPGAYPHRYQSGKAQLEAALDVRVVEMAHTLAPPDFVRRHPAARAADLMAAFADSSINAVISTIGGDDSIRILPYVDLGVLRSNPKIFLGYSDSTVTHFLCQAAGIGSFYGPSIMAGFGENGGPFPSMLDSVLRTLCTPASPGRWAPSPEGWTAEHLAWTPENQSRQRRLAPPEPWRWLQGKGRHLGWLTGGCVEVVDFLRGGAFWPPARDWAGAVLFLETSEDKPPPAALRQWLRSYAHLGILSRLAGIMLGRPGGGVPVSEWGAYDEALLTVVVEEEGLTDLPIVTALNFGHTDPMAVLPYGRQIQLDCDQQTIVIMESCVA
jgi:muramoyltetrapeptide carboxypeptidase LdcA involved in peptidoglycan recycling